MVVYEKLIVLGKGNFWFYFRLFIQFLALWSMDEKAESKIALAKYYHYILKDTQKTKTFISKTILYTYILQCSKGWL